MISATFSLLLALFDECLRNKIRFSNIEVDLHRRVFPGVKFMLEKAVIENIQRKREKQVQRSITTFRLS